MKELCQSLPPSGTYAEQHLLESIPEEDQAALLPIIKLAFPILEWGRLQSFCPREVGLSMQTRHGIMQMEYQHRLPLSKEVLFSTDEGSQVDKSLCTSLVSVLPSSMFTGNVTQVSERAAPEESCTMTDGKNLLSLGSPPSEKCLGVDACIKDVLACTSSEYSWLQQQEASLGAAFHCGDHVWKRVSAENTLDLSSCTSRKSSESNELQGGRVIEATNRHGNSKESVTLANNKRKASSTCWQGHDVKSKRVQISCYTMANDVEFSQETEMRCSSPESTVAMRECSDKLAGTHVAGSAILDRMMELHKLERCHRSNGKQWRCSKNASPGTLYCELHHKYRSKCRIKKNVSPGKAGFLEQKRAAFLKEKQVNVARCHRTDGKLWQCAKQAMPGSLYCENHHNRFKKSKKQLSQLRESSLEASKNKPIVVEEGHVSKLKEGNGLDETSVLSSMKRDGLMQLCDIVAEKRELEMSVCGSAGENELEANRQGAFMGRGRNLTQMEDVAGLVSLANGQKEDRAEPVLPQVASPKPKKSVNGLGQFIDGGPISREVPLVVKEGSNSDIRQVGGSGHSDAKPQGTEDGVSLRCHRNDGRQWRCFELSKPGSSYCEQQQIFEPWAKADKITEAEGHSLENLPNKETRSPNEDRGDSNMDSADDCFAGSSCHREQLQEVEHLNNIMSQDVASLKQCQRKDGKGWQCLKDAKAGYNYCPHHLEYLSKRKTRWNKNRSSKPVVNGFSLSDKASPAIPTILNQEESAREFSNKPLDNIDCSLADPGDAYSKHGHAMHIVGAEITPQESSCGSDDLVSSLADPLSAFCKHGHCTHTRKAPTILQESLSVNERIQMQEACTSFSNLIDEINTPQDISEKEIQACVDKNTQQHQHLRLGRSILCSHNQKSCVAHDSSCNEGSFKEEIKSPFDKTSAQHTLDTVGGADVACDKGKILHESNQFNGTFLQEISSLKQCQRKDGKYWQCSKSAKQGQNYCLHHLVYLRNRRYASKSCRKANHQLGSEDRALFTGDGPFLCSTISSSATPSMLQKGLCARKPLLKSGTHLAQDVHSCLADPVDAIWNQNESDCQKQESSTGTIVETENSPQESCSGACIKHEICAGLSNEIDAPQNIQEGTICFDSKN